MNKASEKLLSFELAGPIAQFRKFYSNISALSYEIPPRTVITGILGSILELPRDSYYELFSPEKCNITVQLQAGVRKYMAYTNYRNPDDGATIQTRIELLFPKPESEKIRYNIFFGHSDQEIHNRLYDRLTKGGDGYGVYLGQRQFRADIGDVREYKPTDLKWNHDFEGTVTTATTTENVTSLENISGYDIISSSMPIHMQKVDNGRESVLTGETVYETTGQGLNGKFKEVLQLPEAHIAFMSQVKDQ